MASNSNWMKDESGKWIQTSEMTAGDRFKAIVVWPLHKEPVDPTTYKGGMTASLLAGVGLGLAGMKLAGYLTGKYGTDADKARFAKMVS